MIRVQTLAAVLVVALGGMNAHAFSFSDLMKQGTDAFSQFKYKNLTGSVHICAANEVKDWVNEAVVPEFQRATNGINIRPGDLTFSDSGDLANNWNDNNKDRCDLIIMGSDVSALRASDFDKTKAKPLAYSPIVFVGQKVKLDAARAFVKKQANEDLTCDDLATVAAKHRLSRILPGSHSTSPLTLEMSTSNSGQSAYISCVYSMLDATSAQEVDDVLGGADGEKQENKVRDFMKNTIFEQHSSKDVKNSFISGEGLGPGASHLAVATYELYLPEILAAAKERGIELQTFYPAISILNNFPAVVVAEEGSEGATAANAFLAVASGKAAQEKLAKYGLRTVRADIQLQPYMKLDIGVGTSPRNRRDLRKMWDIVGHDNQVMAAKILDFPAN